MQYTTTYSSPIGEILLAADETGLIGLWFKGQKYYARNLDQDYDNKKYDAEEYESKELPFFSEARRWLDIYFSGREPDFMPPLHLLGTPFQKEVWEILRTIPYGETTTYGEIAEKIAQKRGLPHMSAQAVGSAVGHNDLSLLIPCHRVIGASGSLTGYAGGIDKKIYLLKLEGAYKEEFFVPKRSTAP